MIVGKTHKGKADQFGTCMTCYQWVDTRDHICREAMGQSRQRSANLDDLLFELRIISSLLTRIIRS